MIYQCTDERFKIWRSVNFKKLQWPDEETLSYEDGLVDNHCYMDMRGMTWVDFGRCYKNERRLLSRIDKDAQTTQQFEELLDKFDGGEEYGDVADDFYFCGMETGIASPVIALSAMGCAPFSSCRGHPGQVSREHAHVVFFARKDMARRLMNLVKGSMLEVGLINERAEQYGCLNLYARDCVTMLNFSKMMRDRFGPAPRVKRK
jgi:hypothetical protein